MSDREKLIELIRKGIGNIRSYELIQLKLGDAEEIADRLISNGVTVQKWVPVSERLPAKKDAKVIRGYVLAIDLNRKANIWKWTEIAKHPEWFTHWMPLPEPPKECE